MSSVLPLSILCAALAACTVTTPQAPASPTSTQANAGVAATSPAPPAPATAAQPAMHRFAFAERSTTPGASAVRIVGAEPTPCGSVLIARVTGIPLDDTRVMPDWVVEFDASGRPVRTWGVPYEALVTAVDGGRVQFRTETGTYWTDAAGVVEQSDADGLDAAAERPASLVDGGTSVACPAGIAPDDGEMLCATVRDVAGAQRSLAVGTVCS